tara:strand:+ start:3687 stop:4682 length:996 start_codon:yes stop_codon:yes gene_type:complete
MSNKLIIFEQLEVDRKKPINFKEEDAHLFQHELKKIIPESYLLELTQPVIINNSIFDLKNFNFYFKHTFYRSHSISKIAKDTLKNIINAKKGIKNLDKGVWIVNSKSRNFGHFIIDAMCRLMLIPDSYNNYPVLLPSSFNINWIIEIFDYLGIKYFLLENNKKYRVNELILTSDAHPSGNFNPDIVNNLRNIFLDKIEKNTDKKENRIWAYREHISRAVGNFEQIEKILNKYNFQLVKTEQLNLVEKINLFKNTEVLAGTHSSGLVNMIFMSKGSKLFEVRDYKDSHKNALFSLASALGIDYFYTERSESLIDGDGNIDPIRFEHSLIECL